MGERVYVKTARVQPVGEANEGARIEYAKPDVNPLFPTFEKCRAWLRYVAAEIGKALEPAIVMLRREYAMWFHRMGGYRQFGFAIGMMIVLGGLGGAISAPRGDTGFWMAVGGLLIGLSVRITRTKD